MYIRRSHLTNPMTARFFHALVFGSWTASHLFSIKEIWCNTMSAYYVMLLCCMVSHEKKGRELWKIWLPRMTTRNIVRLLGQMVIRIKHWPARATFEPRLQGEDAIEFAFGQIKSCKSGCNQGTTNTSNSVLATQLLHTQRARTIVKARRDQKGVGDIR